MWRCDIECDVWNFFCDIFNVTYVTNWLVNYIFFGINYVTWCHIYIYKIVIMLDFDTQEQVLNHLGKKNDRNLIKRMLKDGRLSKRDGRYYLNEELEKPNSKNFADTAKILELSSELDRLKEENQALRMVNDELKNAEWGWDKEGYIKFSKLNSKDLYDHLKFFYEKYVTWKSFVDWKAFWQMQYNNQQWKQDTMDMVSPEVYARYNFEYWEIEKAECEFVESLINDRQAKWLELPF